MTINSSANKTIVSGNGTQTQFTFSFVGVATAFITVILTDASGNETVLVQGNGATQYQISLNAPVQGALWGLGGTVTYDPSGTPIPTGSTLTIFRTLPLTQAISLQNLISLSTVGNGAETGLDTLEMQLQQVSELFGRSIVAPIVDPDTINLTLPAAAQRANLVLGFDGNGDVIATTAPSSGTISSAMQPVVNAASLAAGRTAFGLGSLAVEGIGAGLQDDGNGNARVNTPLQQVATNQAIHAANHLDVYAASGSLVFTLDAAATLFDGFSITVLALTGPIALNPNASDNFFGQSGGAPFTVPQGCCVTIETNGAGSGLWVANVTPAAVTKAIQQAATSALNFVTPLHQQDHPSAAKAWLFFQTPGTIITSYNIASVVKNSPGSYTVTFSTPFASSNYASSVTNYGGGGGIIGTVLSQVASDMVINILSTSGTGSDPTGFFLICFGQQ